MFLPGCHGPGKKGGRHDVQLKACCTLDSVHLPSSPNGALRRVSVTFTSEIPFCPKMQSLYSTETLRHGGKWMHPPKSHRPSRHTCRRQSHGRARAAFPCDHLPSTVSPLPGDLLPLFLLCIGAYVGAHAPRGDTSSVHSSLRAPRGPTCDGSMGEARPFPRWGTEPG